MENLLNATNAFKTAVANFSNNVHIETISIADSSEEEDADDAHEIDEEDDDHESNEGENEDIGDVASNSSALFLGEYIEVGSAEHSFHLV